VWYGAQYQQVSPAALVEVGIAPSKLRAWLDTARDFDKVFEKACPQVLGRLITEIHHGIAVGHNLECIWEAAQPLTEEALCELLKL